MDIIDILLESQKRELGKKVCAKISRFINRIKGMKFDEREIFVELENLEREIQELF